jgi:hypothetical protein
VATSSISGTNKFALLIDSTPTVAYIVSVATNDVGVIVGPTGPQGPQGIQGIQGVQGPAGSNATAQAGFGLGSSVVGSTVTLYLLSGTTVAASNIQSGTLQSNVVASSVTTGVSSYIIALATNAAPAPNLTNYAQYNATQTFTGQNTFSSIYTNSTSSSVFFAGVNGLITSDWNNFWWNDSYSPAGTLQVGARGANPIDATLEVYANAGNVAHFHFTGAQGTTGGAIVDLSAMAGSAIQSGNRLGSLQFAGSYDTTLTPGIGGTINSFAMQNWTSTALGADLEFKTVPNNSTTRLNALVLNQDQSATFANQVTCTAVYAGSLIAISSGTITRNASGYLSSVSLSRNAMQATISVTRDVNNYISTIAEYVVGIGTETWTYNRDANENLLSWTVSP